MDVKIDGDNAFIRVVPIPDRIWNMEKYREYSDSKNK